MTVTSLDTQRLHFTVDVSSRVIVQDGWPGRTGPYQSELACVQANAWVGISSGQRGWGRASHALHR